MFEAENTIRIQYCAGEIGWAERQDDDLYKILNTPVMAKDLRWGDIVSVIKSDGILRVKDIVRRQLPYSAKIFYIAREIWPSIVGSLRARYKYGENISVEGSVPPKGDSEGFATVNYNDEVDLEHAVGCIVGVRIVHDEDSEDS